MGLKNNQTINSSITGRAFSVKEKLGEGGQGEVYLVEGEQGPLALKWYSQEQSTEEQYEAINYLVQQGPPAGPAGERFIWPLDLVKKEDGDRFGYLMRLIDTTKYAALGEVQGRRKPQPSPKIMTEISYQLADSYRALHLTGHCYRDISQGNFMFDPLTGEVLICDNDNVGINKQSKCQVLGTIEYMSPELILGKADPSTDTDLHSLAVLLYHLWMWHHPLHGDLECVIRSLDMPAKKRLYGERPVFIYHPQDESNRPNHPDYTTVRKRWAFCPKSLQDLFVRAFTTGLTEPTQRVTEGEWRNLFLQLQDGVIQCDCKAENLWEQGVTTISCWNCKCCIAVPPKLCVKKQSGTTQILLTPKTKLLLRHFDAWSEDRTTILGELAQHPTNPKSLGIRNLGDTPWTAKTADGALKEVPPGKAIPLSRGLVVNIKGIEAELLP